MNKNTNTLAATKTYHCNLKRSLASARVILPSGSRLLSASSDQNNTHNTTENCQSSSVELARSKKRITLCHVKSYCVRKDEVELGGARLHLFPDLLMGYRNKLQLLKEMPIFQECLCHEFGAPCPGGRLAHTAAAGWAVLPTSCGLQAAPNTQPAAKAPSLLLQHPQWMMTFSLTCCREL